MAISSEVEGRQVIFFKGEEVVFKKYVTLKLKYFVEGFR